MAESSPKSHSTAVAAEEENSQGGAEAKLTYLRDGRYILALSWRTPNAKTETGPDVGEFRMALIRSGTKEQVTAFIEEWLLKFPDPDLMTEALEKCNGKLPEGERLF
jgi:hypothetical protein